MSLDQSPPHTTQPTRQPSSLADQDGHRSAYWFPAKRYGWGWGLPTAWQGWVVIAVMILLSAAGMRVFLPRGVASFLIYQAFVVIGLFAICYLKGEPPKWRWGDDESH